MQIIYNINQYENQFIFVYIYIYRIQNKYIYIYILYLNFSIINYQHIFEINNVKSFI